MSITQDFSHLLAIRVALLCSATGQTPTPELVIKVTDAIGPATLKDVIESMFGDSPQVTAVYMMKEDEDCPLCKVMMTEWSTRGLMALGVAPNDVGRIDPAAWMNGLVTIGENSTLTALSPNIAEHLANVHGSMADASDRLPDLRAALEAKNKVIDEHLGITCNSVH